MLGDILKSVKLSGIKSFIKRKLTKGDVTGDYRIISYEGFNCVDYHIELLYEDGKWRSLCVYDWDMSYIKSFNNIEDAKKYAIKYLKDKLNQNKTSIVHQSKVELE